MKSNLPQMILIPGSQDPGISSGDREESDLDLEVAGAIAPNATIFFVYAEQVMDAVSYAIDQNLAPVISVSYGSCEPDNGQLSTLTFQTWAQQANSQGITWFDAAGDDGAADCSADSDVGTQTQISLAVDTPASVPEVTGVGGTQFVDSGGNYWSAANTNGASALSYIPETAWNTSIADSEPSASGGGLSIFFSKPTWQVGPGVPGNNARNVPDVAFNADPDNDGYIVFTDGSSNPQIYGGTSCGTPLMAGIAVLLNQYLGTPGLGNINPQLYSLAQSNPAVFHDITTGNNIVTPQIVDARGNPGCGRNQVCPTPTPIGYNAGVGYDNVTGLGSVDAWKLMTCWSGTCSYVAPPVPPITTTLSLVSNLTVVGPEDYVFLTATATAIGSNTTPTGQVTFSAGTTSLGPVPLSGLPQTGISTATYILGGGQLPLGSTNVTATYDGSSSSAPVTSSVLLSRAVTSSSNGTPAIQGLTEGAAFQPKYSPGMVMSVFGASLSPPGTAEPASSVPLPLTMAGVSATVNEVAAPLYYVSPTQLNIQVPWQTAANSPATLTINNSGQVASRTFETGPASPGIFTDQTNTIVPNATVVTGQTTTLFMAGAGPVTPAIATGSAPSSSTPLSELPAPQNTIKVTVNGVPASTTCSNYCFVGIPQALVGVTQINFQVPSVPAGRQPVVVTVDGLSSPPAFLNVSN
jgi:uncharacterized protein (TIGR03437 family)